MSATRPHDDGDDDDNHLHLQVQLCSPLLPHERVSIDQALEKWAGQLGPAQLLHFALVSLLWCLYAMLTLIMVFADRIPSWACTPALDRKAGAAYINVQEGSRSFLDDESAIICNASSSICSMDASLWEWARGPDWSTVSQWGLTCGQAYKVDMVQSLYFAGNLLGAGVYGILSDSMLGRKGVVIFTCALSSLFGLLTALSPNYWVYVICRMATGFNCGGMGPTAFLLATEAIGPAKRGPASMATFFFFSVGIILLSILAYVIPSWRQLYVVCSVPGILYSIFILPFLLESPRWHLAHGRADVALSILRQIAVRNGTAIPSNVTLENSNWEEKIDHPSESNSELKHSRRKATMLDIFHASTTRTRMVIMLFIWFSNGLLYYGINLEVPNSGGDPSVGLILNAIAEMPAYVITAVMLQRCGRRPVLSCAMGMSGVSCLAGTFLGSSKVKMGFAVVAIFGVASSYNLLFVYTAELFPTEVRNIAMGLAVQAAQVGAIVAPFSAMLGHVQVWLPFSVFCIASLLASSSACWLPETLDKPMYETQQDMLGA